MTSLFAGVNSNRILPLMEKPEADLQNFLPTEEHRQQLLCCLLDDDVAAMERLCSKLGEEGWQQFLQSSAAFTSDGMKMLRCKDAFGVEMNDKELKIHTGPSNPFLLAAFYGSRKILLMMQKSISSDYRPAHKIKEFGFNALTILLCSVHFGLQKIPIFLDDFEDNILNFIVKEMFNTKQLRELVSQKLHIGMNAMEFCVYIGRPDLLEFLLDQFGSDCNDVEIHNLHEHHSLNLGMYSAERPSEDEFLKDSKNQEIRFSTHPLLLLADKFSVADAERLKELGTFRNPTRLHAWLLKIYYKNRIWIYAEILFNTALLLFGLLVLLPKPVLQLRQVCQSTFLLSELQQQTAVIVILGMIALFGLTHAVEPLIYIFLRERWLCQQLFPSGHRHSYRELKRYTLVCGVICVCATVLLCVYLLPANITCSLIGDSVGIIAGTASSILVLAMSYKTACLLRFLPVAQSFTIAIVECLNSFFLFSVTYLVLIFEFSRILEASSQISANMTIVDTDSVVNPLYSSFLLSLNVLPPSGWTQQPSLIDLAQVLSHLIFILTLPVFFINFVIALLSMLLSDLNDCMIEIQSLLIIQNCMMLELVMSPIRTFIRKIRGQKFKDELVICRPISWNSRSMIEIRARMQSGESLW